jgi:2,4-dienoyl-CoA reductase-like NADH-dependent reductase (Old Yellow Enzyme family)
MLMQLHYASKQGEGTESIVQIGPSEYDNQDGYHRALTKDEVKRIRDGFIVAAVRAEKAGYDGIELHGAHGYLLCMFMNTAINVRTDEYGNPTTLVNQIIAGIRQTTGTNFIISCRVGADNPDIETGIANCKALEAAGLDMLHISSGISNGIPLATPEGFPFSELAWRGYMIKQAVQIPVIAVGGLDKPECAKNLISEGYADFAAVGRGQLVDPSWATKTVNHHNTINPCKHCKMCVWFRTYTLCPGRRRALKAALNTL